MAESPSHKWGQIIGEMLQSGFEPPLSTFASEHGLYLDKKGPRATRRGNKITWTALYGNRHDLDFVLESKGNEAQIGNPLAFIETAWRRYTKHSKNKAQEIQGAIQPLVETYRKYSPFIGAILAGEFTASALDQLKSNGFTVLFFTYDEIMSAFRTIGFDAHYGENTTDVSMMRKITDWEHLPSTEQLEVANAVADVNPLKVSEFRESLRVVASRRITNIQVLPLHGSLSNWPSIVDAIRYIQEYDTVAALSFFGYEIRIEYSNDDRIDGRFANRNDAVDLLQRYANSQ